MRRPRSDRPILRRDADGNTRSAPDWETLSERLIREAQEAGAFDDLPGRGQPLHLDDDHLAGDMALANGMLKNAGLAPPWIEADKEVRRHRASIDALIDRAARYVGSYARLARELEELCDAHDRAARSLSALAPSARRHRGPIDRSRVRSRLRAAFAQRR